MSKAKLGECCAIMRMVLIRDNHGNSKPRGFTIGQTFSLNGEPGREQLVYEFCRAKKTDASEHGHGSSFATATYAPVKHCPFCGEIL